MNNLSRRNFLHASSAAAVGALLLPHTVTANINKDAPQSGLVTGIPNVLRYNAIPGFLSAAQIAPHYTAHYGGALRGYLTADQQLQSSILSATTLDSNAYGAIQRARTNKGNSVLLHELYFGGMALKASIPPQSELHTAITKRFGSIEKWATDFQAAAKAASGWAVLAAHSLNGKLYNSVCDQHATGVLWMSTPLLVLDVYEHAYYLDYKNNKTEYIAKYMQHIDWKTLNQRYINT